MRIGFPGTGRVVRPPRTEFARPEHEVLADPELAYRRGVGIDAVLLRHRANGKLTVSVTEAASGASFEQPVAPDEALTALHHPLRTPP